MEIDLKRNSREYILTGMVPANLPRKHSEMGAFVMLIIKLTNISGEAGYFPTSLSRLLKGGYVMERFACRVKLKGNQIVCASSVKCTGCQDKDKCEELDIYIKGKYQGVSDCMTHDSHEKRSGKVIQKRWGRD